MQPCGRETCVCVDVSPRTEAAARPPEAELAALDSERAATLQRAYEENDRALVFHECGHTAGAIAAGFEVHHVQVSGTSGVCRYVQGADGAGRILALLAGNVGEAIGRGRIVPPHPDNIRAFLAKARRGEDCGCDEVIFASMLVQTDLPDDKLVAFWLEQWSRCVALLADTIEGRCALHALAAELRERRMMSGQEVLAVVNAEALQAARQEIEKGLINVG